MRAAHKKLQYAYVGRKLKKREMRKVMVWLVVVVSYSLSLCSYGFRELTLLVGNMK